MIKKKHPSKEDLNTWKSYIKNPTDIIDKEHLDYPPQTNVRFKYDLHGYLILTSHFPGILHKIGWQPSCPDLHSLQYSDVRLVQLLNNSQTFPFGSNENQEASYSLDSILCARCQGVSVQHVRGSLFGHSDAETLHFPPNSLADLNRNPDPDLLLEKFRIQLFS